MSRAMLKLQIAVLMDQVHPLIEKINDDVSSI